MKDWKILAKARMKELNITQVELAKKLGCTQPAIAHWLNGKRTADIELVNKIFIALELPLLTVSEKDFSECEKVYKYPVISWQSLDLFSENWKPKNLTEFIKTEVDAGKRGFWLKVQGDSMTASSGFSFPDGMHILVNPDLSINYNDFVIVKIIKNNQAAFKKYIEEAGIKYLKSLNTEYKIITLNKNFKIIGKVIDARWKLH